MKEDALAAVCGLCGKPATWVGRIPDYRQGYKDDYMPPPGTIAVAYCDDHSSKGPEGPDYESVVRPTLKEGE